MLRSFCIWSGSIFLFLIVYIQIRKKSNKQIQSFHQRFAISKNIIWPSTVPFKWKFCAQFQYDPITETRDMVILVCLALLAVNNSFVIVELRDKQ